ncbi:MAG: ROK family protein [Bernardetiaceae bacterium]|nr:ROK family protein [Bernardetiaceae bacterium]
MANYIGVDLGGTLIKALLLSPSGEVLAQHHEPTQGDGEQPWKAAIRRTVDQLAGQGPVAGVGLSAPGLPNPANTCIHYMPGRLQGLEGLDWGTWLGRPVRVLNDAHAATLAEVRFGAARGHQHVAVFTLGTGVGGGLVVNGQLYQGLFQKAGHLGHLTVDNQGEPDITGVPGSLEDAIGNATVAKRSLGAFTSTRDLLEAYRQGQPFPTWLWLDSVRKLAIGIASVVNAFSPELVVLGGGITQAEADLFGPLAEFMARYEWRPGGQAVPIVKAHFGDLAGAVGAASFAMS